MKKVGRPKLAIKKSTHLNIRMHESLLNEIGRVSRAIGEDKTKFVTKAVQRRLEEIKA